jgi:hypothetical protein
MATGALSAVESLSGLSATVSVASGALAAEGGISGLAVAVSAAYGGLRLVAALSGRSATVSRADGTIGIVTRYVIAGISVATSQGDGWLGLPFVPGALPPVITAIVFVNPAPQAEVDAGGVESNISIAGIAVAVSTVEMNASVTTDRTSAEVT